ncbi:MAG: type II CRISPR RNA-guided endonuclease Cas9, partial [Schwartzia sp.]|nr:type II CRISPR RNA-guided endonuclease Cas9 [Schwartzia sp. (in: firmicutes)]
VKACRKLIPHLETGMTYDKACAAAGYDFHGKGGEKTKLLSGKLEEIQNIPNPVVRRAVAQTIKVVNAVIRRYGSPVAVNVELAREMGRSFQDRREMMKSMEDNNAANEKLKDELKGYGVAHPNGLDIVKLKLYKEQGGVCAYSLAAMPIEKVLKDPSYAEVDHILPYSRSFDDSYANKVLVLAKENRDKGNRTPMEYMANLPGRKHDFITWVQANVRNPKKRDNLLLEKFDEDKENAWKERHLTDTKYISSFVKNLLEDHLELAPWLTGRKRHVLAVNGAVTDYTRKRLGIRKIREDGDLHHAVDAAVIATVTQGNIQKLTNYSKRMERAFVKNRDGSFTNPDTGEVLKRDELMVQMSKHFPEPWPGFRHELEARVSDRPKEMLESLRLPTYTPEELDALRTPFVSRMPTRKVRGAAHLETVVSPRLAKEGLIVKKVSLDALKLTKDKDAIENYYAPESDRLLYEALLHRLQAFGGDGKKAFAEPFHKPKADGTSGPVVRKVKIAEKRTFPVLVHQGKGRAANGGMVRVDVFFIPEGKEHGYYLVPVYTSDVVCGELPMRAVVQGNLMKDENFMFSLYPNDLIYIESKKEIKVKLSDKLAKKSSLPKERLQKTGFFYYKGVDIANAQLTVVVPEGTYVQGSLGVKRLSKMEKWTVDVLGGEIRPVHRETRQDFETLKRDPYAIRKHDE